MTERIEQEVQRGALVNALGVLGKMAGPAFLVLVTRLYGPDTFGVFITTTALVEMGLAFLTAGFKTGALRSVAHHADHADEEDRLYQLLANTLGWSLFFAALLIVLTYTLGARLLPAFYDYGGRLYGALSWMVPVLPLMAFDRIVIAATQGLKIMKYDALVNGGLRPALLLGSAMALYPLLPTETGLAIAYVAAQGTVGLAAFFIYARELKLSPLVQAFRHFELDRDMLAFAIPQNLNRTLDQFITNIDIIMLGLFGVSASTTGFYGAGALIVREMKNVKQIFAAAYMPHIVRLHRKEARAALSRTLSETSRWVATLAFPLFLALMVLRGDLLRLVHPDFAGTATLFMLILLMLPYLECSFGLTGNVVVMTGYSNLNLLNNVVAVVINVGLNLWLIPHFGLPGAAAASVLAAAVKGMMEIVEAHRVARARLLLKQIYPPHVAGLLTAAGVLVVVFSPASLAPSLWPRIGLAVLAVGVYAGGLLLVQQGRLFRQPSPTTEAAADERPPAHADAS
jgi:O-antigen/teichoic acid export membrane protein